MATEPLQHEPAVDAPTTPALEAAPPQAAAKTMAYTNDRGEVSFRGQGGKFVWVPQARVGEALQRGLQPESREDYLAREHSRRLDAPVEAALGGFIRSATLGAADWIATEKLPAAQQHMRQLEEANPVSSAIGSAAGTIASTLIPGAPLARAGAAGRAAGEAAAVGGGGLAARALPVAGQQLAEGAAIGASQALSRGLLHDDLGIEQVAKEAVAGAAIQGFMSLAGLGLSAIGGKVRGAIGKARGAALEGMEGGEARLNLLLQRERELAKGVSLDQATALPPGAPQTFASRAEALAATSRDGALQAVRSEISAARTSIFEAAGRQLQSAAAPLGALLAVSGLGDEVNVHRLGFGALLLALPKGGIGKVLSSAVGQRATSALLGATSDTALGKAGSVLSGAGRVSQIAATTLLSDDHLRDIAKTVTAADPAEVGRSAAAGYQRSGLEQGLALEAAAFQQQRLALIRTAVTTPDRVEASRLLNALEDPRRITKRMAKGDATSEDLRVLRELFPRQNAEAQAAAADLLERPARLTARHLSMLEELVDPTNYHRTVAAMASAQPAGMPGKGQKHFATPDASLPYQKIGG